MKTKRGGTWSSISKINKKREYMTFHHNNIIVSNTSIELAWHKYQFLSCICFIYSVFCKMLIKPLILKPCHLTLSYTKKMRAQTPATKTFLEN